MNQDKLNRKASYGTVYGHPQIGYEQNGQQFKHDDTLYSPQPEGPKAAPTLQAVPTVAQLPSPDVLKAIEGLSSQIKTLNEPKGPDPARSEKARKIWADRRAREAELPNETSTEANS